MGGSETGLDPKVNANLNSFVQNEDEDQNNSPSQHHQNSHIDTSPSPRSQLQIQIGPNGGPILDRRHRNQNNSESVQQMGAELIAAQIERKDKLLRVLNSERSVMAKLGAEVSLLRTKLQPLPSFERLKNENQRLRIECGLMTKEVDLYDNGAVPLGWTLEEFYQGNFNPGQDANGLLLNDSGRRPTGTRIVPPPRPPPPRFLPIPQQAGGVDSRTGEWYCTMCTFQNHPELSKCEQCDMVRVITPNREQNIHIRVRHKIPQRHVLQSWGV